MSTLSAKEKKRFPRVATWKLVSLVVGCLFVVVSFLYAAEQIPDTYPVLKRVLQSLAAIVLTSGIISVVANVLVRRELARFWLDAIGIKESVERAGLQEIDTDFYAYDFRGHIRGARAIDICVIHDEKWFGNRLNDFREFLSKADSELRVCLLDENSTCAPALTENFSYEEGELARKINNSIFALKSCIEEAQKEGKETGHLLIYKQNLPPKHTYYRFDDVLIIVPYNLSRGRTKLPVIAFRRRQGGVSEFLEQDFERLLEQHAKPVYDSHKTEK